MLGILYVIPVMKVFLARSGSRSWILFGFLKKFGIARHTGIIGNQLDVVMLNSDSPVRCEIDC